MAIVQLDNDPNSPFPAASQAAIEPNGLLAWGGDLSTVRLLNAYRHGIFPWYNEGQPILWWSPRPRSVIYPENVHISRRLKRRMRSGKFTVTVDRKFASVVDNCANRREEGTWITADMARAYVELHQRAFAHSIEVWHQDILAGGLYGLAIGKAFFAESMFSAITDASKVALVYLCKLLQKNNFSFIDCQLETAHLNRMGAENISRKHYLEILEQATALELAPGDWLNG